MPVVKIARPKDSRETNSGVAHCAATAVIKASIDTIHLDRAARRRMRILIVLRLRCQRHGDVAVMFFPSVHYSRADPGLRYSSSIG